MPLPKQQYLSNLGAPLAGGKVYTYAAGTSTPKATFTDPAGTVAQKNPIPLNLRGEPDSPIYWSGNYRVEVRDMRGVTIYVVDNYNTDPGGLLDAVASLVGTAGGLASSAGAALMGYINIGASAVRRTVQDRLRDSFNAKDYGLVGDGSTAEVSALNALVTWLEGRGRPYEIVFADGDYLIDSSMTINSGATLTFSAGARLVLPTGTTLTLKSVELKAGLHKIFSYTGGTLAGTIRNPLIYPEWWGSLADGLHPPVGSDFSARAAAAANNTGPLQAALNFAGNQYAVNGLTGTVQLPYGYYVHDGTLSVPLSVNVIGYGIGSGLFYYGASGNAMECIGTNNSMLKDFFLAPIAGPTWNYSTGFGLYMDGVSTPIVDNIWSSGFGGGTFFFKSVIEGRIRGCISDNSNGPAFTIRGVGQGTVIENCVTAGTDGGACFDIQSGYDWHLIGCTAKDGGTGTNGYYFNACENINMTACGAHSINREGILMTASTLNCTLTSCFVNDASMAATGIYPAISVSGSRNKLIAPKVTANDPKYNYGISLFGGATDCTVIAENITPGTLGALQDAQPIGSNMYSVRKVSTVDATPINVWNKLLNNNAGAVIEATVIAKQRGSSECANFKVWARAVTSSSGTTLSAPAFIVTSKSNPASTLAATLVLADGAANAGVVSLQITGLAAGLSVDWEATVTVLSVTG